MSLLFNDLKGNAEKILVIDDVESQRDISCKVLETFAYKTKAVSGGEEAVKYLKENTVDLILLNMILPIHSTIHTSISFATNSSILSKTIPG